MARTKLDPFGAWLEGYRLADQDNKNDLMTNATLEGKWNQNDASRLQNLFNYDTYGLSRQAAEAAGWDIARQQELNDWKHRGNVANADLYSKQTEDKHNLYNKYRAEIQKQLEEDYRTGMSIRQLENKYAPVLKQYGLENELFDKTVYRPRNEEDREYGKYLKELTRFNTATAIAGQINRGELPPSAIVGHPDEAVIRNMIGGGQPGTNTQGGQPGAVDATGTATPTPTAGGAVDATGTATPTPTAAGGTISSGKAASGERKDFIATMDPEVMKQNQAAIAFAMNNPALGLNPDQYRIDKATGLITIFDKYGKPTLNAGDLQGGVWKKGNPLAGANNNDPYKVAQRAKEAVAANSITPNRGEVNSEARTPDIPASGKSLMDVLSGGGTTGQGFTSMPKATSTATGNTPAPSKSLMDVLSGGGTTGQGFTSMPKPAPTPGTSVSNTAAQVTTPNLNNTGETWMNGPYQQGQGFASTDTGNMSVDRRAPNSPTNQGAKGILVNPMTPTNNLFLTNPQPAPQKSAPTNVVYDMGSILGAGRNVTSILNQAPGYSAADTNLLLGSRTPYGNLHYRPLGYHGTARTIENQAGNEAGGESRYGPLVGDYMGAPGNGVPPTQTNTGWWGSSWGTPSGAPAGGDTTSYLKDGDGLFGAPPSIVPTQPTNPNTLAGFPQNYESQNTANLFINPNGSWPNYNKQPTELSSSLDEFNPSMYPKIPR